MQAQTLNNVNLRTIFTETKQVARNFRETVRAFFEKSAI
jgi:hypothetical protein